MSLSVEIKKRMKGFFLDVALKAEGDYLGILGASGSGKSMTLKCIAGIETPDEGKIILNNKVLYDSEKKINLKPQDRNVGYLFQNYALFPHMTVAENIGIGIKTRHNIDMQRIDDIISAFHLNGLENKYPHQISGGQQQRVALARCIVYQPDVLMLDEPFSALDTHLKEQMQIGVMELLKLYKGEVLMVTHSREEIYGFCKSLVLFDKGKSILSGETKEIFKSPKLSVAARLTGCKNISRCSVLDNNKLYAEDWKLTLEADNIKLEELKIENIRFVGFRAHDLELVDINEYSNEDSNSHLKEPNIIKCKITNIIEDIFEYKIFFINAEDNSSEEKHEMLYKVNKDKWNAVSDKENVYLKIPSAALLVLE